MPQLPSVSELMVGAHLPMFNDHTTLKQLPQSLPSDTTPRHLDYLLLPNRHHLDGPYMAMASTLTSVSPRGSMVLLTPALALTLTLTHVPSASAGTSSSMSAAKPFANVGSLQQLHQLQLLQQLQQQQQHPPPFAGMAVHNLAPGDYFSYRANTTHNQSQSQAQGQGQQYSAYKRTGLVLLLLESILRMPLAANSVPRVDLSPSLSYAHQNRLSSFSHESSRGAPPTSHIQATFQTNLGPMVYGQQFQPYGNPVPLQMRVNGASAQPGPAGPSGQSGPSVPSGPPMGYGLPPLGQAVLQPYGIQLASPYQPMVVGGQPPQHMAQAPPPGMADQNYALMNKRRIIKRRTRTGCLTCRKRRIKCDERKPHCFNCERLKKLCLGYEVLPLNSKRRDLETSQKPHRSSVHDLL